jgi:hypothetical protein
MREKLLFDFGWKFFEGEIPFPVPKTHPDTYLSVKAGLALGAAAPAFDDSQWKPVDLPHDWMIELPYDPGSYINSSYLKRGEGWYRRTFLLEPARCGAASLDRVRRRVPQREGLAQRPLPRAITPAAIRGSIFRSATWPTSAAFRTCSRSGSIPGNTRAGGTRALDFTGTSGW